ncbi:MAG: hypothetical protein FJW26_14325 [Acidimicrobiia bacterium]|nr:hypothetical protein [Acidimicrobiia bacterium]
MIDESLIQSIVHNVVHRLQAGALEKEKPASPGPNAPLRRQVLVEDLYQNYRARYLPTTPFEERISHEFFSSLPVELGRPLVCLYERHQPCDHCGRCEVRGF